ncbi:hypothetical protein PVAND_014598 [Polypedilum vanderplanki]|uniref:Odorant receptor n=1 Tax=Polypedilum vanderplanki TaxID=319348 RepID=A0A9J6B9V1_POLVA|nr:hypothetical protein PVAND_014598 [Polypedilum vanderplanki]
MNLSENLRIFVTRIKSYFVSDEVRNFVLFLKDFFPSENVYRLFGFTFFNKLQNNTNQKRQRWQKGIIWTVISIYLFFTILTTIDFAIVIGKPGKFAETVETFGWIAAHGLVLAKIFFFFYWKRDDLMKIVERLDQHFPHSNREQLQFGVIKIYQNLKTLFRIILSVHAWNWLHFVYLPLILFLIENELELLHPIYFPVDPLQPLLYPIFFILQTIDVLAMVFLFVSFETFTSALICITAMEFDVLAQKLSQIDPESDENAEVKLQRIIDAYNDLADIASELEDIFSPLLLIQVFAGIFMICVCIVFMFLPIRIYFMIKFVAGIITLLVQLFCICFYGEQLQISSTRVADEAYNCNWYGKNLKFRKIILLTMLRAQHAQKLTGWKFMDVGLPVFYWSLQTAHSYYSLLSGLYET